MAESNCAGIQVSAVSGVSSTSVSKMRPPLLVGLAPSIEMSGPTGWAPPGVMAYSDR